MFTFTCPSFTNFCHMNKNKIKWHEQHKLNNFNSTAKGKKLKHTVSQNNFGFQFT